MRQRSLFLFPLMGMFLFLFVSAVNGQPRMVLKTWGFESSLEDWASGDGAATIELSTEKFASGTSSVKLVGKADHAQINLQNDAFDDVQEGDVISYKVWISAADLANVNGFQAFYQDKSWGWASQWVNATDFTGDAWTTVSYTYPAFAGPLNRIGFQVVDKSNEQVPTIYVDDITIKRLIPATIVKTWGFETALEDWASGDGAATIELSTEKFATGTSSVKLVGKADHAQINVQNDAFEDVQEGDVITYKVWISTADLANVNGGQAFFQDKSWGWNALWVNATDLKGDAWNTVEYTFPAFAGPLNRIGFQLQDKSLEQTPTIYVDDVTIYRPVPEDPTVVTKWGQIGRFGWPIIHSEVDGSAGIGGTGTYPKGGYATLRGEFTDSLTATETQAVVVSGKIEFIGGGPTSWGGIRYGLYRHDSVGAYIYAGTDSSRWSGKEGSAFGYLFIPQSGTNYAGAPVNWAAGGGGTQGSVSNSTWLSTFGTCKSIGGHIQQAPARAKMDAGVYNFAFSVRPLSDGTNEVKWKLVKEDNAYWYAGTIIDSAKVTTTFNGVLFAINNGNSIETTGITGLNVSEVHAQLGDPITIPEAPFNSFYIQNWGAIGRFGWKVVTDPDSIVGNSGIGGTGTYPKGGYATLRGGFDDPVSITLGSKAIIVSGELEFLGGGATSWGALRYGLFRHDSAGTLINVNTDSVRWNGKEGNSSGYLFIPQSGTNYSGAPVNWASGGGGTQGTNSNSTWLSTFGTSKSIGGHLQQAPARADLSAGVYDFKFSVRQLADSTNEVKWFLIKKDNGYWYAGTFIDSAHVTTAFNGVLFAINNGNGIENTGITGLQVSAVKVDLGDAITIPEAPFNSFYIEDWGAIGRFGWPIVTDPDSIVGNSGMGGTGTYPKGGYATLRGGFVVPVTASLTKAVIVTGQAEFLGGGATSWGALRYGIFRHDTAGTLINVNTDSVRWNGKEGNAYGYLFIPQSGTNYSGAPVNWASGGGGTQGTNSNSTWLSTFGTSKSIGGHLSQAPARADLSAGVYNFAFSVIPLADGTNQVKWYFIKADNSYWYGGTFIDSAAVTSTFNGVLFAINNGNGIENTGITGLKLTGVKVDKGAPITIPKAPWEDYYIDNWGFNGGSGGWTLTPGEFTGNIILAGTSPISGTTGIRAAFDSPVMPEIGEAVKVEGEIQFVGGGFENANSLMLGMFQSDSAGTLTDSTWTGNVKGSSGYLFVPKSGTNSTPTWGTRNAAGTSGAIVSASWFPVVGADSYLLSNQQQEPTGAVGTAGTYKFGFSFAPQADASTEVRYYLTKDDNTYSFKGIAKDSHAPIVTNTFNSINFAFSSATATAINISNVMISVGDPLDSSLVDVETGVGLPTEFALEQNYPNPFNPSTTIRYDIPTASHVRLVVYDILGRVVTTLVNELQAPNRYSISWNATGVSSGVYFYRLETQSESGEKNIVSVKKLIFLK